MTSTSPPRDFLARYYRLKVEKAVKVTGIAHVPAYPMPVLISLRSANSFKFDILIGRLYRKKNMYLFYFPLNIFCIYFSHMSEKRVLYSIMQSHMLGLLEDATEEFIKRFDKCNYRLDWVVGYKRYAISFKLRLWHSFVWSFSCPILRLKG